jgi:GH35 family endo-1,4-beta-xylanase
MDYIDAWYRCGECVPDLFNSIQAYYSIPFCGDDECNGYDSCSTCPEDCGSCPIPSYEESPFGISIAGFLPYKKSLEYIREAGASTAIFMSNPVWGALLWDFVEPEKGVFNWSMADERYLEAKENGLNISVKVYPTTPEWDSDNENIIMDYPNDVEEYLNFIRKAVERYDGDGIDDAPGSPVVNSWMLGDEMNRGEGWLGSPAGMVWWNGTEEQYADLFVKTYEAMKSANPEADLMVHGTNFYLSQQQQDDYPKVLLQEIKNASKDIPNFSFVYPIYFYPEDNLQEYVSHIDDARTMLDEEGFDDIPIIIGDIAPFLWKYKLLREQKVAEYVVKYTVAGLAHDMKQVVWAQLSDGFHETYGEMFEAGLISDPTMERGDGDDTFFKNLGFYTYKLMTEKLEGSDWNNIITVIDGTNNVYAYKFNKSGSPVWIVWNDNSTEQTITLNVGGFDYVRIREAVPNATNGTALNANDYPDFFDTEIKEVTGGQVDIALGESPVFVEECTVGCTPIPFCGDGNCDADENCSTCPEDCGSCPIPSYEDYPFGIFGVYGLESQQFQLDMGFTNEDWWNYQGEHFNNLGSRWTRQNTLLIWAQKEPVLGDGYVWDQLDDLVVSKAYEKSDPGFNLVLVIAPIRCASGVPPDCPLDTYIDESEEVFFKDFVKAAVNRYPEVKYWQAFNEPFPSGWAGRGGTLNGYLRFIRLMSEAVREADPDAKIILGAEITTGSGLSPAVQAVISGLADEDVFDIVDMHYWWYADDWKIQSPTEMRAYLDNNGYGNAEIWMMEHGTYVNAPTPKTGGQLAYQSEKQQASFLIKSYMYNLANDMDKVFWNRIVEFNCFGGNCGVIYDNMGLISDGRNSGDTNLGVERLSYYTYKKMTDTLAGSDWDNIQKVQESNDVYIYEFNNSGKPVWVAWKETAAARVITITGITASSVEITEAVPNYDNGIDVTDYSTAFNTETRAVSGGQLEITLGASPIFVEELD